MLRARLPGLRDARLVAQCCIFKTQYRNYASFFNSPLDDFDAVLTEKPQTYARRRALVRAQGYSYGRLPHPIRSRAHSRRRKGRAPPPRGPQETKFTTLEPQRYSLFRPTRFNSLYYARRILKAPRKALRNPHAIPRFIRRKRVGLPTYSVNPLSADFVTQPATDRAASNARGAIARRARRRALVRRGAPKPKKNFTYLLEQSSANEPGDLQPYRPLKPKGIHNPELESAYTLARSEWLRQITKPPSAIPPKIDKERGTVTIRGIEFHPALLRDACTCSKCVDPASTQKNFHTAQIPENIRAKSIKLKDNLTYIKWENDVPGFGDNHVSIFPAGALTYEDGPRSMVRDRDRTSAEILWDVATIKENLEFINFKDYMTSDKSLRRALRMLVTRGILIIRDVPERELSVEDIALRIGNIRDTLYGRTWDVKSVPDAKNVAYTAKFLGLHMDLLYMANPPGFQFLHCLKSTAKGGASLFADGFQAAGSLTHRHRALLEKTRIGYHYKNAGEHYYHSHPFLEQYDSSDTFSHSKFRYINYSPPFQANYLLSSSKSRDPAAVDRFLEAFRAFSKNTELKENLLEYRLKEGECVIFNNRRVLHGRKQFDALGGERWLKGTYVDTDVVNSRYRVLKDAVDSEGISIEDSVAQYVFERTPFEDKSRVRRVIDDDQELVRKVKY